MLSSLVINWIVGPAVDVRAGLDFLPDLPEYRTGLIIVGLARCIAMVIIWNDLACGDREAAAVLVALNSVFQVIAFGVLGWFYLDLLPGWLGLGDGQRLDISMWKIAQRRLIFLGIPLLAGLPHPPPRRDEAGARTGTSEVPAPIGPFALYGLLFTIVVLFALQGRTDHLTATGRPADRAAAAGVLRGHVGFGSYLLGKALGLAYERTTTLAFTAAGNNFELAIAVAIATFGVTSGQALAGVVGPLIEVPVLVGLVYVALAWRKRFAADTVTTAS
jgi:ACR3 family arsenite transporter